MGRRSYPIYTQVTACNYESNKSFGSLETSDQKIYVGTGKKNSHLLARITTTKRLEGDEIVFKFGVDGNVLKEIRMCNKTKEIINGL